MPQQIGIELNEETEAKLLAIPSAVTMAERQLALYYLGTHWDGTGDIFENGPLLGSVTRALGIGMLSNEKRDPASLLWTYDWFSFREDNPLDLAPEVFDELVANGLLTAQQVDEARSLGDFLPVFTALHREEDYWPLVRPCYGYLPGHRDDDTDASILFRAPDREFAIGFVDGCKSWYGTKHWFREIVPHLRPGADLIFQDYGHYTCFWIPMLIATFRERFELIAYVDRTYVWRQHSTIGPSVVESRFPDEPTGFSHEEYDEAFNWLVHGALERGDRYAAMIHECHRAAAYAYLDQKDEAREILDKILMMAEWFPLRPYLKGARYSPTYTPEGQILL